MSLTPEEAARVEQALADVDYAHLEIARVLEEREEWSRFLESLKSAALHAGKAAVERALPLLFAAALESLRKDRAR